MHNAASHTDTPAGRGSSSHAGEGWIDADRQSRARDVGAYCTLLAIHRRRRHASITIYHACIRTDPRTLASFLGTKHRTHGWLAAPAPAPGGGVQLCGAAEQSMAGWCMTAPLIWQALQGTGQGRPRYPPVRTRLAPRRIHIHYLRRTRARVIHCVRPDIMYVWIQSII